VFHAAQGELRGRDEEHHVGVERIQHERGRAAERHKPGGDTARAPRAPFHGFSVNVLRVRGWTTCPRLRCRLFEPTVIATSMASTRKVISNATHKYQRSPSPLVKLFTRFITPPLVHR
jgi:hypothetical protein